MAKFLNRRERTTLRRRGAREVVRTRVMHGDWILREKFHLVEPGSKPRSKSSPATRVRRKSNERSTSLAAAASPAAMKPARSTGTSAAKLISPNGSHGG
jgi:hypothetical protein